MKGIISTLETNLKFANINIYACEFAQIWLGERPITNYEIGGCMSIWRSLWDLYKIIADFSRRSVS